MGYRLLLKRYMKGLRAMVGTDYVEDLATRRTELSKRDIGELRSLAAELNRETETEDIQPEVNSNIRS